MWPFKKKEKIFTETFCLDFLHKIYFSNDDFNIEDIFNKNFSKLSYVNLGELQSIFVELFSLVYYLKQSESTTKWIENSFRLDDSIRSYMLNIKHDNYTYEYTLSDYNTALSNGISIMYEKKDIYDIFQKRLALFGKYHGTQSLSCTPYQDIVITRSLNRMGAKRKKKDKIFYSMSLHFLQNNFPEYDNDDLLKIMDILNKYYSIIDKELSDITLY